MNNIIIMHQAIIGGSGCSRGSLCLARDGCHIAAAAGRILALEANERCARIFTRTFEDALGLGENADRCAYAASSLARRSVVLLWGWPLRANCLLEFKSLGDSYSRAVLGLRCVDGSRLARRGQPI